MQCTRLKHTAADFIEQKRQVNELLKPPTKGQKWYLIDVRWWNKWTAFVDAVTTDESLDVAFDDYPGEVDNSALLSCGELKSDLLRESDFTLLPEDVWNIFINFFGCSHKDSSVFQRSAIELPSGLVTVEIYPPTFHFIDISTERVMFKARFSECQTIGELKSLVRKFLRTDMTENIQLFIRDGIAHEEFKDDGLTIGEASLEHQKYLYVKRVVANGVNYGSARHREATSTPLYGLPPLHASTLRQKPGMCGLNNLGNTCFMNSAIQCMSNVPELTDYFLKGTWKGDINKYNPLGSRGKIANAYGDLIERMWSGQYSYEPPRALKQVIAGFATQFHGYAQHDSHELLAVLSDGLHEDLNRANTKPYIEVKDADGRSDEVVAKEAWCNYRARNDSIIVDLFHGQLKSTVICPTCNYRSVTFDPSASLNLPLPDAAKYKKVVYIWPWVGPGGADRQATKGKQSSYDAQIFGLIRCEIPVQSTFYVRDLLAELERERQPYPGCQYHLAEVYNHSVSRPWHLKHQVRDINGPPLFAYELPPGTFISVRLRDPRQFNTSGWVGVPFYISIPTNSEQDVPEDLILQAIADRIRAIGFQQPSSLEDPDDGHCQSVTNNGSRRQLEEEVASDGQQLNASNTGLLSDGTTAVDSTAVDRPPGLPMQRTGMNGDECPIMKWLRGNVFCTDEQNLNKVRLSEAARINLRDYYGLSKLFIDCAGSRLHAESERLMRSIPSLSVSSVYSRQDSVIKLTDCVRGFVSIEQLGARDLWYCSKCKDHKQATKHFELWCLPKILVIQLKRFRSTSRSRDKIDTLVDFPIRGLDLTSFLARDTIQERFVYDLIAVSNHIGSLGGGHYTAYALNNITQRWCLFDDASVREVDESVIVTSAAYVLVYRRRQTNQSNSLGNEESKVTAFDPNMDGDMDDSE